jgi:hypothetical protein
MNDRILEKYGHRPNEAIGELRALAETDEIEDFSSFGWLRGMRERAVMLELRKKTGNILAIGYAWVERIEFDPSQGITLHVGGRQISIRGRNLNAEARPQVRLFQGITRQRVPWIQEADEPTSLRTGKNATVIGHINW